MYTSRKALLAFAAAVAAVDQSAAFAPAAGSLRLRAPAHHSACQQAAAPTRAVASVSSLKMSSMGEKYGHLRGAEVEPCGAAVERFYKFFGKPVRAVLCHRRPVPWTRVSMPQQDNHQRDMLVLCKYS